MSGKQHLIGAAGALTGKRTAQTKQFYYGTKLAIDVWNEDHVQKADLIWADDMADQEKATSAAEYLIKHNVEGVVGHFSSICALNAAPIYLEKNIPLILPAATSPGLTSLKNVFRLCAMDNQSAVLISEIALRKIKSQRILLVNDGSYYGFHHVKGIYDEIKRRANEEIEILIQKWGKKDQNLIECMLNFNPDLVVFSGRCHVAIDFSKGTHEIFSKIPVIFGDDVIVKEYLDNVNFPLGWIWAVGPPPLTEYSGALDFIEKYKMKVGFEPGFYAASTYASVQILLQALDIAKLFNQDLINVLYANHFTTILGKIEFLDSGEMSHIPISLLKLENKQFNFKDGHGLNNKHNSPWPSSCTRYN